MRDERWELVVASVGPEKNFFTENVLGQFERAKFTEFYIQVRYGPNVFHSRIIVEDRDLEEARLRMYQFTPDKMVEQIDHYMDMAARGDLK